jgi:hypothetical protein
MIPVSPRPPAVAANRPASSPGSTVTGAPAAGVSSCSERTAWRMLPSRWWFLPCTSLATAPPTVTNRVPGVEARNQPEGTVARSSRSRLTPACTVTRPLAWSKARMPSRPAMSATSPPAFWAASP